MSSAKTDGGGGPHFTWLGVWLLAMLAMLGGSAPLAHGADTLISTGAVWKYLDTGVSQGTNWRRPDFDDSAWTNGPAQLGFGDGDEARVVNGGPATARFITLYFRRAFELTDPAVYTNLQVRLLRDDGGVVYLNGVEVFRSNMPTGTIAYATLASATAAPADETTNFFSRMVSPALLLPGPNVVAVEVHQNSATSTDLSFDLALLANVSNAPPVVALTAPTNNAAFKPGTNLTLTATATDPDDGVALVEFFQGLQKLGERTSSPYSLVWSNVPLGEFTFRAVATDTRGVAVTSAPVNISVVANFLPAVALTTPTNNSILGGPMDVTLTATASDSDGAVGLVEFFEGVNKRGEATAPPFSVVWSNAALGLYTLTAVATDNGGAARTSAPVALTIRTNTLPTVSLTTPRSNVVLNVFSNVVFTATATDSDGGIARVEFYEDGHWLGEDVGRKTNNLYTFAWPAPAPGSYTLRAVATDLAGGARTSAPVPIFLVTNLLPTVAITNPPNNGLVNGRAPVNLQVSAVDLDSGIALVELFQAGRKIAEAATPPYHFALTNLTPGHYLFRARATDNAGDAVSSATVSVTVQDRLGLVGQGSVWKYLATNASQGTAWRELNYDDSFWPAGRAQLGYGDGDEVTVVPFGPDANNKYVTTYFRQSFVVTNLVALSNLAVRLLRDDGGVVYLNGVEVFRSNMPTNDILYGTLASASATAEDEFYPRSIPAGLLREGTNVLAVEIHQSALNSSDMSFDADLTAADATAIVRGPYLQLGTPTSVIVRWRTDGATDSRVRYGTDPTQLDFMADDLAPVSEHSVTLTGLAPGTAYYYTVGTSERVMEGGLDCAFTTAPPPGAVKATRIWVLGDSGTGDNNARAVRDSYYNFSDGRAPDLWLMLGDNAYNNGTEEEFQNALFDMFPATLKSSVLWPIISNHDTASSTNPPLTLPTFLNFTLPTNGEAGGVPSGTEKYYSFDYGGAHFVCLDSQTSLNSTSTPMLAWLAQDLAANQRNWTIVTCGNPPYGHVGNDTDTMPRDVAVRNYILPILEAHGVDLFFAGDAHGYERSYLMNGHYGLSGTLTNSMILDPGSGNPAGPGPYRKPSRGSAPHQGTVYVVAGSSGHLDGVPATPHPANYLTKVVLGSVVLDVTDTNLDVRFLTSAGVIEDHFRIVKDNFAPTATALDLMTDEDVPLTLPLNGRDREGRPLNFTVLSMPTNGGVWLLEANGGAPLVVTAGTVFPGPVNLLYLPPTNFHGTDSLWFKANDGFNDSAPARITITVASVNDVPAADAQAATTDEDTPLPLLLTGTDADGDALVFRLTLPAHGAFLGTPPNVAYVPARDYHGPDSFTFTVADGQSESPPAVVEIFVNPVNDMPVVQAQSVSVNEDEPLPVHLAASDVEGDPLAYVVTPPARGTLAGTPPELVYRPFSNYHGPDSFTYRVSDGALTSAVATVSIMVLPVNDPPVADAKNLSLDEDTALLLTLTGTDLDGDALTFLTTLPAHGALAGVPPNLIYRPTTNYHGPDSFTFTVGDGRAISPPVVVAITVRPVNDPPTARAQFVVVSEDTTLPLTLTGADVDGDALVFLVAPPGRGWLSGAAPNVVYHAPANYFGEDSFTFRASDGRATSAVATVQILILSVNDAPTADAQSLSVNEDTSLPITLTGADAEGDALMFLVSPPEHGTLTGAAPNLVYRPATNYHGPDSFTFTASDGLAESLPGTVALTVVPVNDAPVADASATPRLKVISPNNTNALVVLDGSRSFDVDHDALRCSWFETGATSALATGLVVAVRLAVGAHPVQLRASDGALWGTNTLTVTIITPGHAVGELIAQVNALGLTDKKKRPLVALLEQAGKEFGRRKFTDGVKHLGNFQQQVQAQLAPANPAGAAALIAGAQAIIDVFAGTGPRPRLQSVACSPGQAVKVRFAGTPGQIYLVQASSDLLRWETVGSVADGEAGDFEWVEPNPSAGACRFYRVVSP